MGDAGCFTSRPKSSIFLSQELGFFARDLCEGVTVSPRATTRQLLG